MQVRFSTVLATGYYDGPTDGIAIGQEGELFTFRLLDWDDGQDMRVFAISCISVANPLEVADHIRAQFAIASGVAIVPPELSAECEALIADLATKTSVVGIMATTDLLGDIAAWQPFHTPLPHGEDWLKRLGLPRR